ncbi:MAG: hypothetical protein AB1695_06075 [Stygiobacter sp.]|jgi:hypothetical protein
MKQNIKFFAILFVVLFILSSCKSDKSNPISNNDTGNSNSNFPHLTVSPQPANASVKIGSSVNVSVSVTSNTRKIYLMLGDVSNGAMSPLYGSGSMENGSNTTVTIPVSIPSNVTPGQYYIGVQLNVTTDASNNNYLSTYILNPFRDKTNYTLNEGPQGTNPKSTQIPIAKISVTQ